MKLKEGMIKQFIIETAAWIGILWHFFITTLPPLTVIVLFAVAMYQLIYWKRKVKDQDVSKK